MKFITRRYKRMRFSTMKTAFLVVVLNIIFVPTFTKYVAEPDNLFKVYLNGTEIGTVGKNINLDEVLCDARREICYQNDGLILADADLTYDTSEAVFAQTDSESVIRERMVDVLNNSIHDVLQHAYTLKIGNEIYNLKGSDEVRQALQAAIDVYDEEDNYTVQLVRDSSRELSSLTAVVVTKEESEAEAASEQPVWAGIENFFEEIVDNVEALLAGDGFDKYEYGIQEMSFGSSIEVADAYLMRNQLNSVDEVIEAITAAQEKSSIYKVEAGDTLSGISMDTNVPMEKIIALNDAIESETSTIRIGQEIVITSPAPPLAIERREQVYIEEDYDAETIYVDNNEWFTNQMVTLQQPSAGHRNIVAIVNYENDKEVSREVVKEEVVLEAVAKIVERGTKTPPTYIKPISGGRMSSTFGPRKAPTRGASTNHKGIDWSVATGTSVYASSGGTVTKAGWARGYGYCVTIRHPDGKETVYAHLSKVLVNAGQTVRQGDRVALSGNSGVSTGPHLHFEIHVNGVAVNPLKYLN